MRQWLLILVAVSLTLPSLAIAENSTAPADDTTFYLATQSESQGVGLKDFPADALGLDHSTRGYFVLAGSIVEPQSQASWWQNCDVPGRACVTTRTMTGTYAGGRLEVKLRADMAVTYSGAPMAGTPTVPGTVSLFEETDVVGTYDAALGRFEGTVKRSASSMTDGSCAAWDPQYGEGGICLLDKYVAEPVETTSGTWQGFVTVPADGAVLTKMSGSVEVSKDGGKTFVAAKPGDILRQTNQVSTGYDSRALLDFGYGSLQVGNMTQLSIDQFVTRDQLTKTQLFLRVGSVQAKVRHNASVRGDFSVVTPTVSASVRGSEMLVVYDDKANVTTVSVTEDKAFVKGTNDAAEIEIAEGYGITVGASGKASAPEKVSGTGASSDAKRPSLAIVTVLVAVLAAAGVAFAIRRGRKK